MAKDTRTTEIIFDNSNQNIFYKVDVITGEVLNEGRMAPVWNTDRIISAEQQAAWEDYKQREERKAKHRDISKKYGEHFFIPRMQSFPDLKPQTAARLIYLLTYADYSEKGGYLKVTQRKPMKKQNLREILGLSRDAVNDFLAEVSPSYIILDENGLLAATGKGFKRGSINNGCSYHRFYDRWVRSLYKAVPLTQHRYLGYIFQLLPFISIEYNVLCYNPTEEDIEKVEFMRLGEFCKEIGFDSSHADRLLKIYKHMLFAVTDNSGMHKERFVSITYGGLNRHDAKVYVNPRILYSGTHPESVKLLGAFSKN